MKDSNLNELKEAYRMVRETNERLYASMKAFQIAAKESGSLVFTYDVKKQTIFVDEQTAKAFGVTTFQEGVPYDMVRRGIVTEDTKDTYIGIHEAMICGKKEAHGVVKLVQADGSISIQELKMQAILNEDGSSTGTAVGVYREITNRYMKELDQQRYQQVILSSQMYTFQYDVLRDVFVVFVPSRNGREEQRRDFKEFSKQIAAGEVCQEEDQIVLREFFQNGSQRMMQVRMKDIRDGQMRWYGISGSVVKENEQTQTVFGSIYDITDWKEQEAAYQKMERVLKGIRDEYIGIFEIDFLSNQYTILSYDPQYSYNLPVQGNYDEFLRRATEELVAPGYTEEFQNFCEIQHLQEILKSERRIEYEFMTNGKKRKWQRSIFRVSEYKDGIPSKAVLYQSDIDRQKAEKLMQQQAIKEAYQLAEEASAAKTNFLSRMSHDIRTPMNAIIGMTAIAGANLEETGRVKECLGKITAASKHLLGLINEVLDMSKIESENIKLQEEEFNLADLLDDMITMILPQIYDKSHELKIDVKDLNHEKVIGDSLRIQQIFVNLISNAIKYTEDGGIIKVSIKERPTRMQQYGEYEICFEDNGIGMSEEFQEILFDPFTRAEDHIMNGATGTGLGMAITKNLVHLMNGNIYVESSLGEGSKFTVVIHLKIQQGEERDLHQLQDLPVLVVDNDQDACISTCEILSDIGIQGEWCDTGQRAVEMVLDRKRRGEDFFAVILDWKMPGMDGIATAREIRKQAGEDIPIIFLTAYDWTEIESEARSVGVSKFLTKPLFKSRLVGSFLDILNPEEKEKGYQEESVQIIEKESKYKGVHLLLAEDNELNAEIAMEIFKMSGIETDWAQNGAEAVKMVRESAENYYDMVFMDIQMPVMDGYKAAEEIRCLRRKDVEKLPIVAMTANAFTEDVNRARKAGMDDHIAKPIDFVQLGGIMKRYLKEKQNRNS